MLIVFLNNKLVTFDTIIPLIYEFSKRHPDKKVILYCFDQRTYDQILASSVLSDALAECGELKLFTDHRRVTRHQNLFERLGFRFRAMSKLLWLSISVIVRPVTLLHFKALDQWPLRLLYALNRRRVFMCEPTTAGVSETERAADWIIQTRKVSPIVPAAGTLVSFSGQWPVLKDDRLDLAPRFILYPPYRRPIWQRFLEEAGQKYLDELGLPAGQKIISYILSSMDNNGCLDETTSFIDLFEETLRMLHEVAPETTVVIKRHPVTKPEFLKMQDEVLQRVPHKNIRMANIHPLVLARISNCFVANFYSTTFDNAHFSGVKTVEYSHYPQEMLVVTGGNSTRADMTDVFIQRNPDSFRTAIANIVSPTAEEKVSELQPTVTEHDKEYEALLDSLAGGRA